MTFYHNDKQKEIADLVAKEIAPYYEENVVTEISPLINFYEAEAYHQNYYNQNSNNKYCDFVITPKLARLRKLHADKLIA